jgi:hypothetical protein
MDPEQGQEIAERDQLWASLRALRSEIDRLASGGFDPSSDRQRQLAMVLARVVAAELDYRARDAGA